MAVYGYVRVSTVEQNPERQLAKMRSLGVDGVFVDRASGKDLDRPEYARMLAALEPGDTVLLDSLDRLGRSYDAVTVEWKRLAREEGVDLAVLDLDFFDSRKFREMGDIGRVMEDMLLSMLAYVADTERKKILRRTAEGIAVAKAAGRYRGRAPKRLDPDAAREAERMLVAGEPKTEVARYLGVHPNTLRNMIADGRLAA